MDKKVPSCEPLSYLWCGELNCYYEHDVHTYTNCVLRARALFPETDGVCHDYIFQPGYTCRTTVSFETISTTVYFLQFSIKQLF